MKLSNVIYKKAKKHNVPADIYTAILMQESSYRLDAKNIQCGIDIEKYKNAIKEKSCVIADVGISQIHYRTAIGFEFDLERLMEDLDYSVEAGAKVLADFKRRFAKREENWWVRYNCGTAKSSKRSTCLIYQKLVERYL